MELNFGSLPSAAELNRQVASKDDIDLPSLERWTNEVEDTIKGLKDQCMEVEGKTGEMKKDISELVDRYAEVRPPSSSSPPGGGLFFCRPLT